MRKFIYGTGIDEPVRMTVLQPSADIAGGPTVDMDDLHDMAAAWLTDESDGSYNAAADLSLDGRIDNVDSDILAANWQNTTGTRPDRHYYYHFDGLGSVVALTDSAGNTAEQYTYDVYGAVLIRDADGRPLALSLLANPYFFTARRFDTETGLYYYRARYYDPYLGRFLQVDAIGYDDGMNLYAYVGNNPVICADPLGLWQVTIGGAYALGGRITFGRNYGRWNVGGAFGYGIGFIVSGTRRDIPPGFASQGFAKNVGVEVSGRTRTIYGLSVAGGLRGRTEVGSERLETRVGPIGGFSVLDFANFRGSLDAVVTSSPERTFDIYGDMVRDPITYGVELMAFGGVTGGAAWGAATPPETDLLIESQGPSDAVRPK